VTHGLAALAAVFAELSLIAVGGANAIVSEMQRQAVAQGWVGPAEFAALYALAQAAPGPNMLLVTLIGWQVAGLAGALVATVAFVTPAALLTYTVGRLWHRFREARWRQAIQAGLTPVTVGLVMAAAVLLCRASVRDVGTGAVVLASAGVLLTTKIHPLWVLAAGAGLGAAGLL
jgi:chromate transporter